MKRPVGYPRYLWKVISESRKKKACEEYKKNKPTLKQICSTAIDDFMCSRAPGIVVSFLVATLTSITLSILLIFWYKTW